MKPFRLNISQSIVARLIKRLVLGDRVVASSATPWRNVVAWVFIALVAAFLTHPSAGPGSLSDAPVPWPAELGLDGGFGI